VSWADDQAAKYEAALENAKSRIAYGKHFSSRRFAEQVSILREMLMAEYSTLEDAVDALRAVDEANKPIVRMAQSFGTTLLQLALINPKALRLVAEAFGKLEDTGALNARAMGIITAYEDCESFPPTFGELKRAFIVRFGEERWKGDFSIRDTLRFLELPLSKSKRGRPLGARSQLKMWGVQQVRKKREISNRKP
jgi:hypothetical protein